MQRSHGHENCALRLVAALVVGCLLHAGCGEVVGDGGTPGGDDGDDEPKDEPGARFEATATRWTLPSGGTAIASFPALARQNEFENVGDEYWVTTDITGDRIPDLVVTTVIRDVQGTEDVEDIFDETYGYPAQPSWRVYPGSRSGFATSPMTWSLPNGGRIARGYFRAQNQTGAERQKNGDSVFNKLGDEAWVLRDLDGDGKPDLVVTGVATELVMLGYVFRVNGFGTAPYWNVYRNTGSGFSTSAMKWPVPNVPADDFSGLSTASSSVIAVYKQALWQLEDMDGDGKPDLVVSAIVDQPMAGSPRARVPGFPSAPHWNVYLNTGTGFAANATSFALPQQRGTSAQGAFLLSGAGTGDGDNAWATLDINADKRPDLVVTGAMLNQAMKAPGYPGDAHWEVYLNSGTGFGPLTAWPVPRGGDGAGGFNAIAAAGRNVAGDDAWSLQDLHGDRLPDLVVTGEFSAGTSQGVYQFGRLANEPHWQVYRNTGAGFEPQPVRWDVTMGGLQPFGLNTTSGGGQKIGDQSWNLVDLDGDAQPELAIVADLIERPDSPGFGFTLPIAPGHPGNGAWLVFRNVP
ncbi:MAG TPA: VCBS repeat-containing protein [Kofleriaceae bacterium]|nr:VCBS repeat-containing protein [Kofleriaceae bacterium]